MAKPTAAYRVRGPFAELTLARIRELTREPEALFWVFVFVPPKFWMPPLTFRLPKFMWDSATRSSA